MVTTNTITERDKTEEKDETDSMQSKKQGQRRTSQDQQISLRKL
jgi:hypothetical protein